MFTTTGMSLYTDAALYPPSPFPFSYTVTESTHTYSYEFPTTPALKQAAVSLPLSPFPAVPSALNEASAPASYTELPTVPTAWDTPEADTSSGSEVSSPFSPFQDVPAAAVIAAPVSVPRIVSHERTQPPATSVSPTHSYNSSDSSSDAVEQPPRKRVKTSHTPSLSLTTHAKNLLVDHPEDANLSPNSLARMRRLRHNQSDQQRRIGIKEAIERLRTVVPMGLDHKINQVTLLNHAIDLLQQYQQDNATLTKQLAQSEQKQKEVEETLKSVQLQAAAGSVSATNPQQSVSLGILDAVGVTITFCSLDGRLTYCNRTFEQFTGYDRHQIIGKQMKDMPFVSRSHHEENAKKGLTFETLLAHLMTLPSNHVIKLPCVLITKAGVHLINDVYLCLHRNAAGRPLYIQGLSTPAAAKPVQPKQTQLLLAAANANVTSLPFTMVPSQLSSYMRAADLDADQSYPYAQLSQSNPSSHTHSPTTLASTA